MKRIISIIAVLLVLLLTLTACFEKPIIISGDVFEIESGENEVIIYPVKDLSEYFTDNICLGIASITTENEAATAEKYCNDYDMITRYNFNNDEDYIARFLIIPKDDTVSYDLYSVKITDEGTVETEFVIDQDIKEPVVFTYDNYESTMPQYGIVLKSNGFQDLIPLSFSGYDGSLALSGHESEVIDLTIYE